MQLNKLQTYFDKIYQRVNEGKYKFKGKKGQEKPELDPKHLYLEVINYFIYTWCLTHNQQNRIPLLFDYVLIPTYINREKEHQFFKQISFEEFFEFLVAIKNTDNKLMHEKRKKKK